MIAALPLPAPRLQLRWATNPDEPGWICYYELVLPLREFDLRREVYDDKDERLPDITEMPLLIRTTTRTGNGTPCTARNGDRYSDPPFRDSAHAMWDSEALGGMPIFVIAPDGVAFDFNKD